MNDKRELVNYPIDLEEFAMEIYSEGQILAEHRPAVRPVRWMDIVAPNWGERSIYYMTTDLDRGNDAQDRGSAFGFAVQIVFPLDGLPTVGGGLIIAGDEMLLTAHGRRKYLAWLQARVLSIPTVILSYDFQTAFPIVVRPGLMLATQLEDDVFRAFRDGHVNLPIDGTVDDRRWAA
jgi:hypothetical protein